MPVCRRSPSGYSLVELSIVCAIIALVAGMTMFFGATLLEIAHITGTTERLALARDALNLYRLKHKRYPCPAVETDDPSDATYGREAGGCDSACPAGLTCSGNAVIGFVPFRTIGLNEEMAYDAWDQKISYMEDKNHVALSQYQLGSFEVQDVSGNEITASPVLGDAIFVLISHGKDG